MTQDINETTDPVCNYTEKGSAAETETAVFRFSSKYVFLLISQ